MIERGIFALPLCVGTEKTNELLRRKWHTGTAVSWRVFSAKTKTLGAFELFYYRNPSFSLDNLVICDLFPYSIGKTRHSLLEPRMMTREQETGCTSRRGMLRG